MKRKPKKLTTKQQELKESWENILSKYRTKTTAEIRALMAVPIKEIPVYRRETPYYPSLKISTIENCTKKDPLKYTGTKMLGIASMHKSNAVPVFSEEEAIDISKMRR